MFQGTTQNSPGADLPVGSDQALAEDGILYSLGVVTGIFGLEPDYQGLRIRPHVPPEFADAMLRNLRYQDKRFTLRFQGYGEQVKSIAVDGKLTEGTDCIFPFAATPGAETQHEVVVELDKNL